MSGVKHEWVGGSFVQVHHGLLRALDGDYETAAVIWAVKWHAGVGWWQASREALQEATCLSERKLRRALLRAREEGYVESQSGPTYDRTLSWRVVWADSSQSDITSTSGGHNVNMDVDRTSTSPSSKTKKNNNNARTRARASSPSPEIDLFEDEFWVRYPRKTDKGHARKAWPAALKKVDDPWTIINACRSYAVRVAGSDVKFLPHPATWLNGERWLDEAEEARRESEPEVGGWHTHGVGPPAPPADIADDPERYAVWLADWQASR